MKKTFVDRAAPRRAVAIRAGKGNSSESSPTQASKRSPRM
jgi:hypothetical protein